MEKQIKYFIWVPLVFVVLVIYSIVGAFNTDYTEDFTGKIIDKYTYGSDMYCVLENTTTTSRVMTRVDLDFYYDHEVGDVVTVETKIEKRSFWPFGYFIFSCVGFVASTFILMFVDANLYSKKMDNEWKRRRKDFKNKG